METTKILSRLAHGGEPFEYERETIERLIRSGSSRSELRKQGFIAETVDAIYNFIYADDDAE